MSFLTIPQVEYIIHHYGSLMTMPEKRAWRHHQSTEKLAGRNDGQMEIMYKRQGWLTDDSLILNCLSEGYKQFIINTAERILRDNPGEVIFNLCPVCHILARTPLARQCKYCGHDWH